MSATLTGPDGGKWVHVRSEQRVVYLRCGICGATVTEGWAYYVGIVAHAHACLDCANDDNDETEEVTMSSITREHLAEIALACESAHLDWEQGRATSPDTSDYVLIAERIIGERIGPEYLWCHGVSADDTATALYEAQCDGQLNEWPEMAEWLAVAVTTGHDLGQEGGEA